MMPDFAQVAELYNNRFDSLGRSIATVGWGNDRDQALRFEVLFRGVNPRGKSILDVGCGLGDLVPWLDARTGGEYSYIGIDIASRLVEDARLRFGSPTRQFLHGDILGLHLPQVDVAVLSGALSFRMPGIHDYARSVLSRMHSLARERACANFLSTYADFELDKNQHYSPEEVFGWARKMARPVNLFHDYPLYEFTLQIGHEAPQRGSP